MLKNFALSFGATLLLATPFALHANGPNGANLQPLTIAPVHGQGAVVNDLNIDTQLVSRKGKFATVEVHVTNNQKKAIETTVAATLLLRPATFPMARMVPMPREVAQQELALSLKPGESFRKTIKLELAPDVVQQLATKKRTKSKKKSKAINLSQPASLYAATRALPVAQSKVAHLSVL